MVTPLQTVVTLFLFVEVAAVMGLAPAIARVIFLMFWAAAAKRHCSAMALRPRKRAVAVAV